MVFVGGGWVTFFVKYGSATRKLYCGMVQLVDENVEKTVRLMREVSQRNSAVAAADHLPTLDAGNKKREVFNL